MTATLPYGTQRTSPGGFGLVLALHLLAFWLLLRMEVFTLPEPLAVLNVSLLTQPAPETPPQKIEPPKPRPVEKRQTPQKIEPVQLAAPIEAPAPAAAPVVAAPPPVPPASTFAPPAPPQPTQPRFDADYLDNPKPVYPSLSRRLGEEGRVVLRVRVSAAGLPLDVVLANSSGAPRLDQAALDTVRRWKFVPARLGNETVAATVLVPIVFSLKD